MARCVDSVAQPDNSGILHRMRRSGPFARAPGPRPPRWLRLLWIRPGDHPARSCLAGVPGVERATRACTRRGTGPILAAALLPMMLACACDAVAAQPAAEPAACRSGETASAFGAAVLAEVNRARRQPRQYARTIESVFAGMDAFGIYQRGDRRIATIEGRGAVEEAVRFLAEAEPRPSLRMASCLNLAAARHAKSKGNIGGSGHVGATGLGPSGRASLLTSRPVACSENIAYGYDDVTALVSALIVDDGVPGRGHRLNLFDPRMASFGSGRAPHLLDRSIDVQLFCVDAIAEPGSSPD